MEMEFNLTKKGVEECMIHGINKFLFWCWNYESVKSDVDGQYYPDAIVKVEWTCSLLHMQDKWNKWCDKSHGDTDLACIKFYSDLDRNNRRLMLEWIVRNYNGESKI